MAGKSIELILNDVRLSYPRLFTPESFKPGDEPRFSAVFIVKKGSKEDAAIKAAIKSVAEETYKAKYQSNLAQWANNTNKMCYTDGDAKGRPELEGCMVLSCHNGKSARPQVYHNIAGKDGKALLLTEDSGVVYAGCYVNAKVSLYAQSGEFPGIRASFPGLQFHRDGDAFGGIRPATADDFAATTVAAPEPDGEVDPWN